MSKNTFLLQEVIDDLINTDKSLVGPLMKLNYFARLTSNQELLEFTTEELNGYKVDEPEIPKYRKTGATLKVKFQAGYYIHEKELPAAMLEEPFNNVFRYVSIRDGIATIERMAVDAEKSQTTSQQLYRPIPMELLHVLQPATSKLYKSDTRLIVIGAYLSGRSYLVTEILSYVRQQLLAFVMDIAEKFGHDIEIESFNKNREINNQTINYFMGTEINASGDGNVINTGKKAKIDAEITINKNKGSIEDLQKELVKYKVEEADIEELTEIIQTEQPNYEKGVLSSKCNTWILNIVEKSLNGVGKLATGVSSNILASIIKSYYGIH